MFFAKRPSDVAVGRWLARQAAAPLPPPIGGPGYHVDDNRVVLGNDVACFERARQALGRWEPFRLGWLEVVPDRPPIRLGTTVGVLVHHLGFWSLNASRIVTVIDEPARFGFVYRTLGDHALDGDERFTVARGSGHGAIAYEILARSRPRHALTRVGHPLVRRLQRRFARDSMRVMLRAGRA